MDEGGCNSGIVVAVQCKEKRRVITLLGDRGEKRSAPVRVRGEKGTKLVHDWGLVSRSGGVVQVTGDQGTVTD